jgi:hypothetical protein
VEAIALLLGCLVIISILPSHDHWVCDVGHKGL